MTDWQQEIELRLNNSGIYQQLLSNLDKQGKALESQQVKLVFECVKYAYEKSKLIIKYMPEYTLHDGDHLFRVLYLMEKIIGPEKLRNLSSAELMLLILTAFFHDLGMSPTEFQIRSWKKDWEGEEATEVELKEYKRFERFKNTFPDTLLQIERLRSADKPAKAQLLESHLISEYIRSTHAHRAREIIANDWEGNILYLDQDLTPSLANLCFSHNQDALELLNLESDLLVSENETINLPYIGVVLRLADLLDFDAKRTPSVLFSHLTVRNPVSLAEWQKHRSVRAWTIKPQEITFSVICTHPAIEAGVREFCDYIDLELRNCSVVLSKIADNTDYHLDLPTKINRAKIQAEKNIVTGEPKYIYKNTSFHLSKRQVIDLLMGTKLYGKPEVALRELIQNSIDACLLSKALHDKWGVPYDPKVIVKYYSDSDNDYLEVTDNGIGMNQEIIDKYYSNIGSSYYKSRDFYDLRANNELQFQPISRFGIGILSCFMVADSFEVETKRIKGRYDFDKPLKIVIDGYDSIFSIYKSEKEEPGTSTKLFLRKSINPWESLSNEKFIDAVKNSVQKPDIPLQIITDKETQSYTLDDFHNYDADKLKTYRWQTDKNIKEVKISFNQLGIEGNAILGFIVKNDMPVTEIEMLKESVDVNGEDYDLSLEMEYDTNEIRKSSQTISIDDDGHISSDSSYSVVAASESRFSIHGITFPGKMFPDYTTTGRKTVLRWSFPMLIVLDLGGEYDLELNSARNEILYNDKWDAFEIDLAFLICKELKAIVELDFWVKLEEEVLSKSKSENFLEGLRKAKIE